MDTNTFKSQNCECIIDHAADFTLEVKGVIFSDTELLPSVSFIAACPPDYRASYTGSGLPFANEKMAFDGTPNKGSVPLRSGNTFSVKITYPNSYYAGLGTVIIPPTLYLTYKDINNEETIVSIPVSKGIPYRLLTYPMQFTKARKDCLFYSGGWEMPVRTQEQILRDSAYPPLNKMADNFWGQKPPM